MRERRTNDDRSSIVVGAQSVTQPGEVDARKAFFRSESTVSSAPDRGDVGERSAGDEHPERALCLLSMSVVKCLVLAVDEAMKDRERLTLVEGECVGGLELDDILVQSRHDPAER